MNKTSKKKHIDSKILHRYIQKNYRIHPMSEYWHKARSILYMAYQNEMELRAKEIANRRGYEYPYLRQPDWIPKGHVSDENKKFVLKKQIAYAAKFKTQSYERNGKIIEFNVLDAFGGFLINLKENQWAHSRLKKKKKSLSKKIEELLDNPKGLIRARKLLNKQRLQKKFKYR